MKSRIDLCEVRETFHDQTSADQEDERERNFKRDKNGAAAAARCGAAPVTLIEGERGRGGRCADCRREPKKDAGA